jgi:signal transduction histidine kinase
MAKQGIRLHPGCAPHHVKEIISRHGGRVWVESSEGSGSTFYVRLPLLQSPRTDRSKDN